MKVLVIGAESEYSIESFYLKYWKLYGIGLEFEFFAAQNFFYSYYNKSIINKIIYKLKFNFIFDKINKLLIEKIDSFQPEIIFVFKGMEVYSKTLLYAKSKNIILLNYNPDNPFIFSGLGSGNKNITESISIYNIHFTYNLEVKSILEEKFYLQTYLLPFGFDIDKQYLKNITDLIEINKVCFIGNPDKFRAKLINELSDLGVPLVVYGNNWKKYIKNNDVSIFNTVYGSEFWKVLRKYRVQLNIMRPHNLNSHNMRTFEIPGIGGIQLAPDTVEHRLFFEEGKEIFLYKDLDDCKLKIDYLLSLSVEQSHNYRNLASEATINKEYTYKDRALQVLNVFKNLN
jgi:spore maturation protein CgeB